MFPTFQPKLIKFMKISKIIPKLILLSLVFGTPLNVKAEEEFNISSCPKPGSGNNTLNYIQNSLNGLCLHTPDKFEIEIFEMGLCATGQNPIANNGSTFDLTKCESTMKSSGTIVDLAPGLASEKTAALPQSSSRPPSDTYEYAYIILSKDIKMNGNYELSDGTICYSKQGVYEDGYKYGEADCSVSATQQDHFDELNDMGDGRTWSGYMQATPMPTGGSVEALLVTESNAIATSKNSVKRLVGLFKTAASSPVVIKDDTNGLEMVLEVSVNDEGKGGSYMLQTNFNNNGDLILEGFGSAPFKPRFTTF